MQQIFLHNFTPSKLLLILGKLIFLFAHNIQMRDFRSETLLLQFFLVFNIISNVSGWVGGYTQLVNHK